MTIFWIYPCVLVNISLHEALKEKEGVTELLVLLVIFFSTCYLVPIQTFLCGLSQPRLLYLWNHLQLNYETSLFVGLHIYWHIYQWKYIYEKHELPAVIDWRQTDGVTEQCHLLGPRCSQRSAGDSPEEETPGRDKEEI